MRPSALADAAHGAPCAVDDSMLPAPSSRRHPRADMPEFGATQVESLFVPPESAPPTPASSSAPPRGAEDEVRAALRAVVDPELGDTIVDLGMVRAVTVAGGDVVVDVALTIA